MAAARPSKSCPFHASRHEADTPRPVDLSREECSMSRLRRASFVVRVVEDPRGRVSGVIERVATGAKEAFTEMEVIGQVILKMLQRDHLPPSPPAPPPMGSGTDGREP